MISIRNAKHAKSGLRDLINYIGDAKDMIMLEVGSYVGDSTEIFAQNFKQVYAVDPWENGYDDNDAASYQHDMSVIEAQFDELCEKYSNITKLKMCSLEAVELFADGNFDFVYIDGIHQYEAVKEDIRAWLPKTNKWIGGHDYQKRFQGTIDAVNEFRKPDKIFNDTSWVIKLD